jgi:hypothetical protein
MEKNGFESTIAKSIIKGMKTVDKLDGILDDIVDEVERESNSYKEIVTFDSCMNFYRESKAKLSNAASFILSVKANPDPKNENDKYVVTQGILDENNKPISLDGMSCRSRVIHTGKIDKKMIDNLGGQETRIFKVR